MKVHHVVLKKFGLRVKLKVQNEAWCHLKVQNAPWMYGTTWFDGVWIFDNRRVGNIPSVEQPTDLRRDAHTDGEYVHFRSTPWTFAL